jgi:hypothetical protein
MSPTELVAGNIRLEEGKPSDLWYSSCVDLVASRFNASDYDASLGVTGRLTVGVCCWVD